MASEQMTLCQLRELVNRQQEQHSQTKRIIIEREQKLKCFKQNSSYSCVISEPTMTPATTTSKTAIITKTPTPAMTTANLNGFHQNESMTAQEIHLRQLRSLRGQVQKQRINHTNLCEF